MRVELLVKEAGGNQSVSFSGGLHSFGSSGSCAFRRCFGSARFLNTEQAVFGKISGREFFRKQNVRLYLASVTTVKRKRGLQKQRSHRCAKSTLLIFLRYFLYLRGILRHFFVIATHPQRTNNHCRGGGGANETLVSIGLKRVLRAFLARHAGLRSRLVIIRRSVPRSHPIFTPCLVKC